MPDNAGIYLDTSGGMTKRPVSGAWSAVIDQDISDAIASHAVLPDVHHPANAGITGTKTLGGFKFTSTNGLLTGFEPV